MSSSVILSHTYRVRTSHLNPELTYTAGVLWLCCCGSLSLSSKHWAHRLAAGPTWHFTSFFLLHGWHFTHWATSPTLKFSKSLVLLPQPLRIVSMCDHQLYCSQSQRKKLRHNTGLEVCSREPGITAGHSQRPSTHIRWLITTFDSSCRGFGTLLASMCIWTDAYILPHRHTPTHKYIIIIIFLMSGMVHWTNWYGYISIKPYLQSYEAGHGDIDTLHFIFSLSILYIQQWNWGI